ncbi:Crp/Fnr family transcriptional regulator [Variovorax sp. J22R133]|uniref:Crp/Fnr family transcriptional regulator n=1 Tax=Variovorax brevis TaxID=3053503 RepID=UPI002576369E|nr:Crp/Fnr family transcriptional regulator [Variovorax sp. J22R133]MDM0117562.1 Crp/Fnr family transcriptional regulator [Variovorax sp. J22R133]
MYLHPLIASVPAAERAEFIRFVQLRSYRRNAVVLDVDEWTDCIYCVATGLVRVVMQGTDSQGVTSDFIGRDRFFLSPSLQRDSYQPGATLIAALPSSVYLVPVSKLRALCARYPEVAIGLLELAVKRVATLREQLRRISASPTERLIRRILHELTQLAPGGAGGFDKRITQAVIASYSGLSREQVNKTMRELENRGLVRRDEHSIHVPSDFASTDFEERLSIDEVPSRVDAHLADSDLFTPSCDDPAG